MAPSQLAIATSSLQRLVKEEASYHKELSQQQARLARLETETGDENQEYMIKQEKTGIEETRKLFPELEKRIQTARSKLEDVLSSSDGSEEEVAKAKEALQSADKHGK